MTTKKNIISRIFDKLDKSLEEKSKECACDSSSCCGGKTSDVKDDKKCC